MDHRSSRNKDDDDDDHHTPMVFKTQLTFPWVRTARAYTTKGRIGGGGGGGMVVYKASVVSSIAMEIDRWCTSTHTCRTLRVLKVAADPKSISELKEELGRSRGVDLHRNLIRIYSSFGGEHESAAAVGGRKRFLAAVPMLDYTYGSVRTIMRKRGGRGFQGREDLILCVLRPILNALRFLHKRRIPHGDISAGHVYVRSPLGETHAILSGSLIGLGYAASVFDDDGYGRETTGSAFLPLSSISRWAAAPEVVAYLHPNPNNNNKLAFPAAAAYSEKADIWLVGITALELAYGAGGLQFPNRNALEAMVMDIICNNKLPAPATSNGQNQFQGAIETSKQGAIKTEDTNLLKHHAKKLIPLCSSTCDDDSRSSFSRSFTSMVIQCLAWDPTKRPTAHKLLSHKFFRKNFSGYEDDGKYFYDHLLINDSFTTVLN
ncbi:unnamed protein product [Cuscuta epithymum]|uniref:Protein kinase domain-containing protein n=1 Tax=Cuscuta epithymum TaxID=186058 RepID=A0AAV0FLL2_9ASTE|nr:unnamed protein product [Cuscuta epithymum]